MHTFHLLTFLDRCVYVKHFDNYNWIQVEIEDSRGLNKHILFQRKINRNVCSRSFEIIRDRSWIQKWRLHSIDTVILFANLFDILFHSSIQSAIIFRNRFYINSEWRGWIHPYIHRFYRSRTTFDSQLQNWAKNYFHWEKLKFGGVLAILMSLTPEMSNFPSFTSPNQARNCAPIELIR